MATNIISPASISRFLDFGRLGTDAIEEVLPRSFVQAEIRRVHLRCFLLPDLRPAQFINLHAETVEIRLNRFNSSRKWFDLPVTSNFKCSDGDSFQGGNMARNMLFSHLNQRFFNGYIVFMVSEQEYYRNHHQAANENVKPSIGLNNNTAIKRLSDLMVYLRYCKVVHDIGLNFDKIEHCMEVARKKNEVYPFKGKKTVGAQADCGRN